MEKKTKSATVKPKAKKPAAKKKPKVVINTGKVKEKRVPHNKLTPEQIEVKFDTILKMIESGKAATHAINTIKSSKRTFYEWLEDKTPYSFNDVGEVIKTIGETRQNRYARACQYREEHLFDEILDIADKQDSDVITLEDGSTITNHNIIQRNTLQIDARKWILGKLRPEKYGAKVEAVLTGDENKPIYINLGGGIKPPDNN